jgi:hypothetical protein
MSSPFFIVALFDLALVLGLGFWFRFRYQTALTSIEEKSAGPIGYYGACISRLLRGEITGENALALVHLAALHLAVPLGGFGLFLHSDGNFLVVIAAAIASSQIFQRVYPGPQRDSAPGATGDG